MKEKMLLKKICSVYADDLHFSTMIFPFIHKEVENNTTIITILENNEEYDPRKLIGSGLNAIKNTIHEKNNLLGSKNQAF